MMKVYIGNIDYNMTEADIKKLCEQFGIVHYITMPRDRDGGSGSRGFCFVKFNSELSADRCIQMLDGQEYQGRVLRVAPAQPRTSVPER